MLSATITINPDFMIGAVDPRLFGSFLEHLGRAVYGGIYEEGSPLSDQDGFRLDTLALVKALNVPVIRYPGGNFVSGFHWEDSVGPRELRPRRTDLAWRSIESNRFGLFEFSQWAKKAGSELMLAVNLGTRGAENAKDLLEYCNLPGGSFYSDLRRKHGQAEPYNVKLWCLGNEMDGPWQIGHKTAYEYARIAGETSRLMKTLDPSIETVACGSSNSHMPSFGTWEETVLEEGYDTLDYLSLHQYYDYDSNDYREFIASSADMDAFIRGVISICDTVQAKKHSKKKIYLSFDEWNVWYHSREHDQHLLPWTEAPHLLEDVYTFEDALLVGSMLITLLNHCDRVKIACLAQLVNVIAPIMTSKTGAWVQTTYYPFLQASLYGRGIVLKGIAKAPHYESQLYGEVSELDHAAIWHPEQKELVFFFINKNPEQELLVTADLHAFPLHRILEECVLYHENLKAINTEALPQTVYPCQTHTAVFKDGNLQISLKKHSWTMLRLGQ